MREGLGTRYAWAGIRPQVAFDWAGPACLIGSVYDRGLAQEIECAFDIKTKAMSDGGFFFLIPIPQQ